MSKLRFTVCACSGEDEAFPVAELNEHAASSKGYLTPRNCEYPQELVLQLVDGRCRLTQVQLLSHQTHIATKIELFLTSSPQLDDAEFQRIGYLTLKSNVESNYLARELKTVHIDHEATFVKLLLHECYINERNIYSQVGIMAVNLCGQPLDVSPTPDMSLNADELPSQSRGEPMLTPSRSVAKPNVPPQASASSDLGFDLRFDAKTAERIREIQAAKDRAVADEDYDLAKRLKRSEEQLKSIGLQLARLEAQKREAVANEDYDLAKRIKDEIRALENSVDDGNGNATPAAASPSPVRSQIMPRKGKPKASQQSNPHPDGSPVRGRSNVQTFNEGSLAQSNLRRSIPSPSRYEQDEEAEDKGYQGNGNGQYGDEGSDAGEEVDRDGDGGPNPHFEGVSGVDDLPDPDDLLPALERDNRDMIDVIGHYLVRCVYSNLWTHRDAAIRKVTLDLDTYPQDPMDVLRVVVALVQNGASDNIAQVVQSAFRLLERVLSYGARIPRHDMCALLANSATHIVAKLGDTQAIVRDDATAQLVNLASARNVGVGFAMTHLTKRAKKPLAIKLLLGRLMVIKKLVAQFELEPSADSEHSVEGILSFLEESNSFAHQSREIRNVAKDLTVSLYLMIGDDVEGYLKSLRPKQMDEYRAAFEAAETAKAADIRSAASTKPRNGNDATGGARCGSNSRAPQRYNDEGGGRDNRAGYADEDQDDNENDPEVEDDDEESVDEFTCPFCGVVDDRFDADGLDQHFWADCLMLTPCKMCGQVIEIAGLNDHLLVECELKRNHRECPRCGEAITVKFYDKHVSLDDCPPRPHPKRANRCALCHDDIAPGKRGWHLHLLEDSCPNNPRGR